MVAAGAPPSTAPRGQPHVLPADVLRRSDPVEIPVSERRIGLLVPDIDAISLEAAEYGLLGPRNITG